MVHTLAFVIIVRQEETREGMRQAPLQIRDVMNKSHN
jgi:hypothetical protein